MKNALTKVTSPPSPYRMDKNIMNVCEMLLFNGYKEESEKLFCASFELSSNFSLCYNMVTLTPHSLINRACVNGDYKTVKNLADFYRLFTKWWIDGGGGRYEYMKERVVKSVNSDEYGPMLHALDHNHFDIYKYLHDDMIKNPGYSLYLYELDLPTLLASCIEAGISAEGVSVLLDDITSEMCDETDIKNITEALREQYEYSANKKWHPILDSVVMKLNISPEKYMCNITR